MLIGSSKEEYMQAIRANPCLILLGFFCTRKITRRNEMMHFIALKTDKACAASPTLAHLPELGEGIAIQWLSAWRVAGFIDD